jgi:hypothetical protein
MKKDKLRKLLMSQDEESINLGILLGKEILSQKEKLSVLSYISKRYPILSIDNFDYLFDAFSNKSSSLLSSTVLHYKDDIMSFKITKDGTKKFNRSANRVRGTRKPRVGTDTIKSS